MNNRAFHITAAFAIIALGLLAYASSFTNGFVWDDASSILINPDIQSISHTGKLFTQDFHAYGRGQGNFYRPLLALSFMADYLLASPQEGQEPGAFIFHLSNLAWHIAASLMFMAILARVGAPRFAVMAAPMLYVLHPLHTEAVTYISGRGDPMAAACMFAALWFALGPALRKNTFSSTMASSICFIAALLSKESAAIFPLLLAAIFLAIPARRDTDSTQSTPALSPACLVPWIVTLLIAAGYGILRLTILAFPSESQPLVSTFAGRLVQASQALFIYFQLIFAPLGLHMERTLQDTPSWTAAAGCLLFIILLAAIIHQKLKGNPRIAAGCAWFLITWLPISGVFPLNAALAEHWLYVPLAGFLWALMEIISPLWAKPRLQLATAIALCLIAGALLSLTAKRNLDWRDNETIFRSTLARNPNSTRVHFNLAVTYEDIIGNRPGARRHYERIIELYAAKKAAQSPQNAQSTGESFWDEELEAHLSLGSLFLEDQRYDAAARHFTTLLNIAPDEHNRPLVAKAAIGMAQCYTALGDNEHAQELMNQASRLMGDGQPSAQPSSSNPAPSTN